MAAQPAGTAGQRARESGATTKQCAECGQKSAVGDVDAGDGQFYCDKCFIRFDYLEEVAQMLRDRGLRSKVLLTGDLPQRREAGTE